jgi:hypothetical protein
VININGNLNGDILLPADFVDQLVAANVPTTTINTAQLLNSSSSLANINNTGINNNLEATAASGNATVDKNTTSGNATTGDGSTNITAFNLTGSNVIGKNSILVFVNVLGKWTGLIVNAPPGTTAAQLGGGITQSLANSTGTLNGTSSTNNQINNNVKVGAQSGDAKVSENTTAGNATTGDADAAINLLNIANSEMSFSDWMGILFINVFGTWNGSFGMNTSAGDSPSTGQGSTQQSSFPSQVFRFAPAQQSASTRLGASQDSTSSTPDAPKQEPNKAQATLGATDTQNGSPAAPTSPMLSRWIVPLLFSGVAGGALLGAELLASRRKSHLTKAIPHIVRPT